MPDYRAAARRAALKAGLDPDLYENQIGAESNFDVHAVSPAGARGPAQIMPATAKGWGVNIYDNKYQDDLDASAKNMADYVRKYGSYENALRAYNAGPGNIEASRGFAETNAYVKKILQGHNPGAPQDPALLNASLRTIDNSQSSGTTPATPQQPSVFDVIRRYDIATDTNLTDEERSQQQSLLDAATRYQPTKFVAPTSTGPSVTEVPNTAGGGGTGKFKITGPNPGRLKPQLVDFAEQVAATYGKPLTGSDGTGHSHLTVNGNVSQHSTGNATDIPATGRSLIEMGQAALIAAGMPEEEARKKKGGLFNVGPHQIIFNTHEGGDHTNHLHISAR